MAKKSKTQRAKASAARAAKKAQANDVVGTEVGTKATVKTDAAATEAPKKKIFGKLGKTEDTAVTKQEQDKSTVKKSEKKTKKPSFLREVRAELKRVTWPTKQDVLRWSVVVVVALLFFGIYVAVLDNAIITPLLVAISGLGA